MARQTFKVGDRVAVVGGDTVYRVTSVREVGNSGEIRTEADFRNDYAYRWSKTGCSLDRVYHPGQRIVPLTPEHERTVAAREARYRLSLSQTWAAASDEQVLAAMRLLGLAGA